MRARRPVIKMFFEISFLGELRRQRIWNEGGGEKEK